MRKGSQLESSSSTDPVEVGRLGRPHGLAGFIVLVSESDNDERFNVGSHLRLATGEELVIRAVSRAGDTMTVAFTGLDDRTAVERLSGAVLTISADERRPLDDLEFWPDQLVGLAAVAPDGSPLGTIVDVVLGPQDRLVIKGPLGTGEVPFVTALVPKVDLVAARVVVDPPPETFPQAGTA